MPVVTCIILIGIKLRNLEGERVSIGDSSVAISPSVRHTAILLVAITRASKSGEHQQQVRERRFRSMNHTRTSIELSIPRRRAGLVA